MDKLLKLFPFLGSTRFWAIVVLALAMLLKSWNLLPAELMDFLMVVCGSHVGIRSLDRAMEYMGTVPKKK